MVDALQASIYIILIKLSNGREKESHCGRLAPKPSLDSLFQSWLNANSLVLPSVKKYVSLSSAFCLRRDSKISYFSSGHSFSTSLVGTSRFRCWSIALVLSSSRPLSEFSGQEDQRLLSVQCVENFARGNQQNIPFSIEFV